MAKWRVLVVALSTIFSVVSGYPYDIEVRSIRATSAVFDWKSTEILVESFLIDCAGSQHYVRDSTLVHNTELHLRSQHVPKGLHSIVIGDLRPNYNYTCYITEKLVEDKEVFNGVLSAPVTFCTDYGAPEKPRPPTILKKDGITYIKIFKPQTTKFGPISGYKLQFHYMDDTVLGDISVIDLERIDPFGKLSPVSVEYARMSSQPMTFQLSYRNRIPNSIFFANNLMNGALKNGMRYRVVTVAYTKCRSSAILFSSSRPSDSFVAVGINRKSSFSYYMNKEKIFHLKMIIAATIALPLFCIVYMCFIGILLICRERYLDKKLHKQSSRKCTCTWTWVSKLSDTFWSCLFQIWVNCQTCCKSRGKKYEFNAEQELLIHLPESQDKPKPVLKAQQTDLSYDQDVCDYFETNEDSFQTTKRHSPDHTGNSKKHEYLSKKMMGKSRDHQSLGKSAHHHTSKNLYLTRDAGKKGYSKIRAVQSPPGVQYELSDNQPSPDDFSPFTDEPPSHVYIDGHKYGHCSYGPPLDGPDGCSSHGPYPDGHSSHRPPPDGHHSHGSPPDGRSSHRPPPGWHSSHGPPPNGHSSHGLPPDRHHSHGPTPRLHHGPSSLPPPPHHGHSDHGLSKKTHHTHPQTTSHAQSFKVDSQWGDFQESGPVIAQKISKTSNSGAESPHDQFDDASGGQSLYYTTSASGIFNTAEEQLDSDAVVVGMHSSDSMFIPRGLASKPGSAPRSCHMCDSSSQSNMGGLSSAVEALH